MQDDWPFTHAAEVKAKQEAEANAKDAARYRWLRDKSLGQYEHPIVVSQCNDGSRPTYMGPMCGKALDNAIDYAMEQK